jgi:hypothetical protein
MAFWAFTWSGWIRLGWMICWLAETTSGQLGLGVY